MKFTKNPPPLRSRDRATRFSSAQRFPLSKVSTMPQGYTGFTLSEVLITLGIIGVLAAMTIPTVLNNIQDAQLKTAFKKAYSVTSQAWAQVVAENPSVYTSKGGWLGCNFEDGTSGDFNATDGRIDAFMAKMNVVKTCDNKSGCWPDDYEFINILGDTKSGAWSPYTYSWVTSDGMFWAAPWKGADETHILVDTNGNKKPNKIGQDIFSMFIGADGAVYFAIDDKSTTGKPVSSGLVCPHYSAPYTINGRNVDFNDWLRN